LILVVFEERNKNKEQSNTTRLTKARCSKRKNFAHRCRR